jgi:hypothetical protein
MCPGAGWLAVEFYGVVGCVCLRGKIPILVEVGFSGQCLFLSRKRNMGWRAVTAWISSRFASPLSETGLAHLSRRFCPAVWLAVCVCLWLLSKFREFMGGRQSKGFEAEGCPWRYLYDISRAFLPSSIL